MIYTGEKAREFMDRQSEFISDTDQVNYISIHDNREKEDVAIIVLGNPKNYALRLAEKILLSGGLDRFAKTSSGEWPTFPATKITIEYTGDKPVKIEYELTPLDSQPL